MCVTGGFFFFLSPFRKKEKRKREESFPIFNGSSADESRWSSGTNADFRGGEFCIPSWMLDFMPFDVSSVREGGPSFYLIFYYLLELQLPHCVRNGLWTRDMFVIVCVYL